MNNTNIKTKTHNNKIILKSSTKYIECKDIEGYEIVDALFFGDTAVTVNAIMCNGRPKDHNFLFKSKSDTNKFEEFLKTIMNIKE